MAGVQIMLKFTLSRQYQGIGGSEGLDRGLLVYDDDRLLVEEGMGLGAVALQASGFTFFASLAEMRHDTAADPGTPAPAGEWTAVYSLDRRLVWKVLGRPSVTMTRLLETFVTHGYMKLETAQPKLLAFGARLVRLFRVAASFQPVASRGLVTVTYRAGSDAVDIAAEARWQAPEARLFIMNELSGTLFCKGLADGKTVRPPSGWQRLDGQRALYNPETGLAFMLEERMVPQHVQSTLFWGREVTDQFCWAGFESDLRCPGQSMSGYRFQIRFRRDGCEIEPVTQTGSKEGAQ